MTQQRLMGAALLAEVEKNKTMDAVKLAIHCGYVKTTRSRSGEARIKPLQKEYYEALLSAQGVSYGLVLPESQKASRSNTPISFKVLKKTGAGVVAGRFMRAIDCNPDDYFFVEEGEDGTLVIKKDVERSEQARLEATSNPEAGDFFAPTSSGEEDEDEEEDEIEEDGDDGEEEVSVEQPALPNGVPSTTMRIPQSVS